LLFLKLTSAPAAWGFLVGANKRMGEMRQLAKACHERYLANLLFAHRWIGEPSRRRRHTCILNASSDRIFALGKDALKRAQGGPNGIPYGQKIETAQRRQRSNIFGLGPVLHNKLAVDA
jgi:hypothetical protein